MTKTAKQPKQVAAAAPTKGAHVGYVRVSTLEQNTARQLEGMTLDHVFTDKASGKDLARPELKAAIVYLRAGDTLHVHSMDRLSRSLVDLLSTVKQLTDKGVAVHFVKEGKTFTGEDDPMAKLMLSMMGAFAEFERSIIKERQREGIAIAKTKGVYKGRKPALSAEQAATLRARDAANAGKNRSALAREFDISRETLYQYLNAGSARLGIARNVSAEGV
jgi:DNA invertase Pin-like site-specific DNA recombinase